MTRHKGQGQGQKKNAQPCKNSGKKNTENIDTSSKETIQDISMSDILGSSRDLLYGVNAAPSVLNPTDMPQHQLPTYATQNQSHIMTNVNNVQTTQTAGHATMHSVNTAQHSQFTNNTDMGHQRPGIPHPVQTVNGPGLDSNIPPAWANSLCQQIGNIHAMLDGHAKRWQMMEASMINQNEKLNSMGKQLSEISNLKQELINTNAKVYDVENEIKSLQTQMTDYDDTIHHYSVMYDDMATNSNETDKSLKKMDSRLRTIEEKIGNMDRSLQETNEKLTDVRWRSMRENLLFFGISESDQSGEHCETVLKEFIGKEMAIDKDIQFDRVHRLGRYNHRNARPRPIVAKFTFYKDRELVRLTAPRALSGTRFGVSEQYPAEIEEKRKPLYGVAKRARENKSNRVKLVKDKLYINEELYDPGQKQHINKATEPQAYKNNRRFGYSGRPDYSRGHTRVFTRSATSTATNANPRDKVQTRNRYAVLQDMTSHNTPDAGQSRVGKKKASSPLEDEGIPKKQNLGENLSDDDTVIDVDVEMTQTQSSTQQSPSLLSDTVATKLQFQPSPTPSTMTIQPSPVLTFPTPTQGRSDESEAPRARDGIQSGENVSA